MSGAAIESLIEAFGPGAISLITTLINKIEQGGSVTSTEWAAMVAQASKTATDILKSRVAAAGMDLNDPKVLQLIALSQA